MTDAAIVNQVRAGDWEAFALLVERYRSVVYGLAYCHLNDVEEAQDAAQEAFLLAFQRQGQLHEPEKFAPWLRQITLNVCRVAQRRPRPERLPDTQPADFDVAAKVETRMVIEAALACLSAEMRLTVTLFYTQGCSLREIARFLDVPVTTVKSRLRDARTRLRKEWKQMMQEPLRPAQLPADFTVKVMNSLQANGAIYYFAFTPDGNALASADIAGVVKLWQIA